jgi:CBS domain-containing protein
MQTSSNFFFSKILHKKIHNLDDSIIGQLNDLVVDFSSPIPKVRAIVIKNGRRQFFVVADSLEVTRDEKERYHVRLGSANLLFTPVPESDIFLARDFLDKQIIDVEGKKVERVNDVRIVDMLGNWNLVAVDIGFRGLIRRLGFEHAMIRLTSLMKREFHNTLVAWDDVQALTHGTDLLRLNCPIHKLNTLHAADLADILEDLDNPTRISLFQSLNPEVAADVLEEVESEVQVSLLETLSVENASDMLERMPFDEAADILDDMTEDTAERLLGDMEEKISSEIRELMEYRDKTIGSLMMSDYLAFTSEKKVSDVLFALKTQNPSEDVSHYVYIIDEKEHLIGVVSLLDLIMADAAVDIEHLLPEEQNLVFVHDLDPIERAMERMLKYNLMVLPVVDEDEVLVGITSLNDLIYEYGVVGKVN